MTGCLDLVVQFFVLVQSILLRSVVQKNVGPEATAVTQNGQHVAFSLDLSEGVRLMGFP
jgi:hypothetical protein